MLVIKDLRKKHGLSLKQLGEIIGVAESTMSLYENGKRQPDFETLSKLADYFNVSVDYLLGRTDERIDDSVLDKVNEIDNDLLEIAGNIYDASRLQNALSLLEDAMTGYKIRQLRNNLNLTQEDLGNRIGVSASTIEMYEQGRRSPDSEKLVQLANLFNVTTDYLLENENKPTNCELVNQLEENVVIYHRNGGIVKKKFSKEQMDVLTKMLENLGEEENIDL